MSGRLDEVSFEILRHRLWAINDEAASAIALISGSPVANEAYDFNSALMTAGGDVVMIGPYVMAHAAALDRIVQFVLTEYADNPGIGPGDMFATNDPYVGAMHQPDVALVAPIFDGDRLIMWCGSVVHQTDVGGPVAGSVAVGARSIYEEPIPLAPIRLVEGGRIRKDIEREYLIRSRLPQLNALDMRGQIAANNIQTERILGLCGRYGTDHVLEALERLVESTERRFRRRLAELPDGRWRHVTFIEHDGVDDHVYPVRLTMTKRGDQLELDFGETAGQAPGLINSSIGTLRGYTLAAVLTLLGYDLPWIPAGYWPAINLLSRRGTLVDAAWPAGVSMGSMSAGHAIRTCVNVCVSLMLDGSDEYESRSMASCISNFAGQTIAGHRHDGNQFGTMLLDPMAGGGGARAFADGVDTAGMINVPAGAIANVETNEYNYPLLYLWRREVSDSGGPGRFRGGVGGEHAYVAHGARGAIESTLFAHGVEQPTSAGIAGGEPGGVNGFLIARGGANVSARTREELSGTATFPPPKATTTVGDDDVFVHWYAGGGGRHDPLERPPGDVLRDVQDGLVSVEGARRDYRVVVADAAGEPALDEAATRELRRAERRARLSGREPTPPLPSPLTRGRRISSVLALIPGEGDDKEDFACRRCGSTLGPGRANVKDHLVVDEAPVPQRYPATQAHEGARRFVFRRFFCPGCAAQLDVEVNLAGEPHLWSVDPGLPCR
jgi:N-methylhydantoinase B